MAEYERVAAVDELSPGQRMTVFVDDIPVLLIQKDDGCYAAIEDVCSHDGQPLTDGPIEENALVCPRHGAKFDLKSGRALCMPATEAIPVYDIKVEHGEISLRPSEGESTTCDHSHPVAADLASLSPSPGAAGPAAPASEEANATSRPESDGEERERTVDEKMIDALRTVIDPELMINIVDLGLIYSVNHDGRNAYVDMTLTSPACPAGPQLVQQAKMSLERLRDVNEAEIKLVMTPPWSPERMTEEARDHLGIF